MFTEEDRATLESLYLEREILRGVLERLDVLSKERGGASRKPEYQELNNRLLGLNSLLVKEIESLEIKGGWRKAD